MFTGLVEGLGTIRSLSPQASAVEIVLAPPVDVTEPARIAEELLGITSKLKIPLILKASYKKANRTSLHSFSGIGDEKAFVFAAYFD